MKLSDRQKRLVADHHSCPLCHSNEWTVAEYEVQPRSVDDVFAPAQVMLHMTCRDCGHVLQFDPRFVPESRFFDSWAFEEKEKHAAVEAVA